MVGILVQPAPLAAEESGGNSVESGSSSRQAQHDLCAFHFGLGSGQLATEELAYGPHGVADPKIKLAAYVYPGCLAHSYNCLGLHRLIQKVRSVNFYRVSASAASIGGYGYICCAVVGVPVIAGGFLIIGGLLTFLYSFIQERRGGRRESRLRWDDKIREFTAQLIAAIDAIDNLEHVDPAAEKSTVDSFKSAREMHAEAYLQASETRSQSRPWRYWQRRSDGALLERMKSNLAAMNRWDDKLMKISEKHQAGYARQKEIVEIHTALKLIAPQSLLNVSGPLVDTSLKMCVWAITNTELDALRTTRTQQIEALIHKTSDLLVHPDI
jgi:hypothetical protein